MKFWVKAIGGGTGNEIQEQLLVTADSSEELHRQLEELLHVSILQISVTDFATQVVDRVSSGADIITVRVIPATSGGLQRKDSGGMLQRKDSGLGSANGGGTGSDGGGGNSRRTSSPQIPQQIADPLELTASGANDREQIHSMPQWGKTPGGSSFPQTPHERTTNSSGGPTGGNNDKSAGSSRRGSSMTSSEALFSDLPSIEKITLKRSDLATLLSIRFQSAFHDAITGCFVRIKDNQGPGYSVVQIVGVHGETQVVVDMIHFVEMRQLDSISNSTPSVDECKAWGKKMISTMRSLVTSGFVEAKLSDLNSSLRAAAVAAAPSPPPSSRASSVASTSQQQHDQNEGAGSGGCPQEPTGSVSKLRRKQTIVQQAHDPFRALVGKNLVRTNDGWSGSLIFSEEGDMIFFGTRQSNCRSKHPRPSDYAGGMMLFGRDYSSVEVDRDVTWKGFFLSGTPQMWRGTYFILSLPMPSSVTCNSNADGSPGSSGSGGGPVDLMETFSCDVTILSGRDISALMNPPIKGHLPVPRWSAGGPLHAPPQIIAYRDEVHAFYLLPTLPSPAAAHRRMSCPASVVGLAHAVSSDPKLQTWTVVSQDAPIVLSAIADVPLFHVSRTARRPAVVDSTAAGPADSLTLLWCDDANTSQLTPSRRRSSLSQSPQQTNPNEHVASVSKYVNSDSQTRAASWTPVPCVCSIGTEEWRANGTRSISLFTPLPSAVPAGAPESSAGGGAGSQPQYVVVAAEDNHRHTVVSLFPLVE